MSKFDYWIPANVKAPRALFKHFSGVTSTPHSSPPRGSINPSATYRTVNLGVSNSIKMHSNRSLRSLEHA